jgi:hypothetical protein
MLKTDTALADLIGNIDPNSVQVHCWIIDTSIEHDHEYFEGFLKSSLQEIMITLRNERHLLRDFTEAIETSRNRGQKIDEEDVYGTAMLAISEQKPIDNLYPQGFAADRFAEIIENGHIWEVLD